MNKERIYSLFKEEGFLEASICNLKDQISFDIYKAQINNENTGNMAFLKNHLNLKNPENTHFKSAFVALYPYYPSENTLNSNLRVALYAQTKDYHNVLKLKLNRVIDELRKEHPGEEFEAATDSKPVLERDLAYRAGLGWIGKNTCLISKTQGSLFFIAEVLTTAKIKEPPSQLKTDHCGTCTKCIDACPTNALTPRKMIVEKCISYRNIESKDYALDTLSQSHENWFFGCDICQTVCPWNEKVHGKEAMNTLTKKNHLSSKALNEIKDILSSSNKSLEKKYREYPFSRARGRGLKRNALQIIYENKLIDFVSFLENVSFEGDLETLKRNIIKSLKTI